MTFWKTILQVRATCANGGRIAKQERFDGSAAHAGRYGFLRDGMR